MHDVIYNILENFLQQKISTENIRYIYNVLLSECSKYNFTSKTTEIALAKDIINSNALQQFLINKTIKGLVLSSLKRYSNHLKLMLQYMNCSITEITLNKLRMYVMYLQTTKNLNNGGVNVHISEINMFFQWCFNEKLIDNKLYIKPMKINTDIVRQQPLSINEIEQIRKHCDTAREKALFEMFYSTGCRTQELANCNIEDIDFNTKLLSIIDKYKKQRTVFLTDKAIFAIKQYLETRTDDNNALFVTMYKPFHRLSTSEINLIIQKLGKKSNISRLICPNILRNTTIAIALQNGMNVTSVQKMIGHQALESTIIHFKKNVGIHQQNHDTYIRR